MGVIVTNFRQQDINFYREYQEKIFHKEYPKEVTHTLIIGDVVKIKDSIMVGYRNQIGIVVSYSGINNYLYVIAYDTRSNRYWTCGFNESELSKLSIVPDRDLYNAFKEYLIKNCFALCSTDFEEEYYKIKKCRVENVIYLEDYIKGNR